MATLYGPSPQEVLRNGGYVYLMRASDGTFKIGASIDPSTRRTALASEYTLDMELISTLYCDDPLAVENELRAKYRPVKVYRKKDWFNLLLVHVVEIANMMEAAGGEVYTEILQSYIKDVEYTEDGMSDPEILRQRHLKAARDHVSNLLSIAEYTNDRETIAALQAAKFALDTITRKASQQQGE